MSTVVSRLFMEPKVRSALKNFKVLSLPYEHESTSYFQTTDRYISFNSVISLVNEFFGFSIPFLTQNRHHDVPGEWFKGPF